VDSGIVVLSSGGEASMPERGMAIGGNNGVKRVLFGFVGTAFAE
jgi:hypothetical protein